MNPDSVVQPLDAGRLNTIGILLSGKDDLCWFKPLFAGIARSSEVCRIMTRCGPADHRPFWGFEATEGYSKRKYEQQDSTKPDTASRTLTEVNEALPKV